jgi:deazaflavin-dependent oxidoreductase (nitroreductase family)
VTSVPTVNRAKRPPGNRLVLALLRSRFHRLLSGSVLQITVQGRRSGRFFSLPVQYARDGDQLVVLPAHADRKRWWRNLVDGAPVSVLLAGQERTAQARVVEAGSPAFRAAAATYGRRFRRAGKIATASPILVTVTLTPAEDIATPTSPPTPAT